MNVLLSIKPKYVEEIIEGNKRYEFRKVVFRDSRVRTAYIYSSSPEKRIVASFEIGDIIEDHPSNLWDMFSDMAGIDKEEFFRYFDGHERGFAIEIEKLNRFEHPIDPKKYIPGFVPPQSFCYVDMLIGTGKNSGGNTGGE